MQHDAVTFMLGFVQVETATQHGFKKALEKILGVSASASASSKGGVFFGPGAGAWSSSMSASIGMNMMNGEEEDTTCSYNVEKRPCCECIPYKTLNCHLHTHTSELL